MAVGSWQLAVGGWHEINYSDFKLLAGFASAALNDLYPTVIQAIVTEITTAKIKSMGRIGMR